MPRDIQPGDKFNLWTVIKRVKGGEILCRCVCGKESPVYTGNLTRGSSKGCPSCRMKKNTNNRKNLKDVDPKIYKKTMIRVNNAISRCTDKNHRQWGDYGGRGIKVYPPWLKDYSLFAEYLISLENHDKDGFLLDRKDNNGNYEPHNLRFVTRATSNLNRRKFSCWKKRNSTLT